ncbi:MAG: formate/nitrite transporter family protein [Clostridiales bacterium]|nr:formate/nitrite transporter family protein [Clostridiales bacterium]
MNSSLEIVKGNINTEIKRVNMPFLKMFILGAMAGMFIAGGAAASNVAMHSLANVGIARTVGGLIFGVGLMMIVFIGGELFTGDCLLIFGLMNRKYRIWSVIRVLMTVWFSNFVGAFVVAALVFFSGQWDYSSDLLGAFTIKVALGKSTMSFGAAFSSGIMCNIFVCGAVLMAAAAKDVAGKIPAIVFPILAFVVSGYEHCVANMYYIPAGILAKLDQKYVDAAMENYGITSEQLDSLCWKNFFVDSSIPVTLGNMVGGMLFVGVLLYLVHRRELEKEGE